MPYRVVSNIPNSVYEVAEGCNYETRFFLGYIVFSEHIFHIPDVPVNAQPTFKGFHTLNVEVAVEEEVFNRFRLSSTDGAYTIIHHSHAFEPVFCFESFMVGDHTTNRLLGMTTRFHTVFAQRSLSVVLLWSL